MQYNKYFKTYSFLTLFIYVYVCVHVYVGVDVCICMCGSLLVCMCVDKRRLYVSFYSAMTGFQWPESELVN